MLFPILFELMQTNYLTKSYHSKNKGSTSQFIHSPQNSTIQLNTTKQMELLTARCPAHQGEILTNYCTSVGCRLPLCPDCIENHIDAHKQSRQLPDICSIKQARVLGIDKLSKLINFILKELEALEPPKSIEKIVTETNYELRKIKQSVQKTIDQYFASLQNHLISRVRESEAVLKKIENTHLIMEKMLGELKNLSEILRVNDEATPGTIKKVIEIDQTALLNSFTSELDLYSQQCKKIEIKVDFDEVKFRENINNTIKVSFRGNSDPSYSSRNFGIQMEDPVRYRKNPTLHFFECGSENLHLIDLPSLNRRCIPLKSFIVPHFHNSLLLSNGEIWLTGGSFDDTERKNTAISKYNTVKGVFEGKVGQVQERSSHSSIEHNGFLYLMGGYGAEDTEGGLLEIQKINIETGNSSIESTCKYGGSCILALQNDNILKISAEGIEIFSTRRKTCSEIYVPNFIWYQSCAGILLNPSEMLVFGGYQIKDENDPGRPVNSSFILDLKDLNDVRVKDKDKYNLPVGGGFRNTVPVMFSGQVFALQNIEENEGEDLSTNCLDGDRVLLKFDGKKWQEIGI